MSIIQSLSRRGNKEAAEDLNHPEIREMPYRPYRVLHADLPFYSDPDCRQEVTGARLVVLRCEDSRQAHRTIECMPSSRRYRAGQVVGWDLNYKQIWKESWYLDPESGKPDRAWKQAVEFIGPVAKTPPDPVT